MVFVILVWKGPNYTNSYRTLHIPKRKTPLWGPIGLCVRPLLFLIYINDIYNASEKLVFHLFADDTNLLFAEKNLKSLEIVVNEELMNIYDWLTSNELSLNVKKTIFVIFHLSQK